MNLDALKAHENNVKEKIDPLPRIEKGIALKYLRTLLNLDTTMTDIEIEKLYREEQKESRRISML